MSDEKKGPLDYFVKSRKQVSAVEEGKRVLELFKEIKAIGDMDVRLKAVVDSLTDKMSDPNKETREEADQKLRDLETLIKAISEPENAGKILRNVVAGSDFIKEARAFVMSSNTDELDTGVMVSGLTQILKRHLNEFISQESLLNSI